MTSNHFGYQVVWRVRERAAPLYKIYNANDFEFAESQWRRLCLNFNVTRATLYELGHLRADRKAMYDYSASQVPS